MTAEGCHEWTGGYRTTHGYGDVTIGGERWTVHRLAWKLADGEIPRGMAVRHVCGNRACINVEHLALGRGGERRASAATKLTADQVAEIRRRYSAGRCGQRQLAAQFGVDPTTVNRIVRGITYV